jgi:Uma2 family endonuclease
MVTLTLEKCILPPGETLPYSDGEPLESDWHVSVMHLLIAILRYYFRDRRDIYIAGNMFIYFDPDQVKTRNFRGPDFFVVKGIKDNHFRNSWVVWEEEGRTPDFVIELASQSTLKFDLGEKKAIYEQILKTPEYIVYDPPSETPQGWRLHEGRYRPIPLDLQGRLWSEQLGLWLGATDYIFPAQAQPVKVLRFFDAQGRQIPTEGEAQAQRAAAAEAEIARLHVLLEKSSSPAGKSEN